MGKTKVLSRAEILLHPVRLRIVMAALNREMTTAQIAEALPDVSLATLYRHIARLNTAGVLKVVGEKPIRGVVEKVYTVHESAASLRPEDAAMLSREEHMQGFLGFAAYVIDQFRAYLEQEEFDLAADGVSYRSGALNLTDAEYEEMIQEVRRVILPRAAYPPAPGRRRRMYSTIVIPDAKGESATASPETETQAESVSSPALREELE